VIRRQPPPPARGGEARAPALVSPAPRRFSGFSLGFLAAAALSSACFVGSATAACPPEPVEIDVAGFAFADGALSPVPPAPDEVLPPVRLPDPWRERRPRVGGLAWYRFALPAEDRGAERCGVLLPDVNMNAAVFVNGQWVGEGGSFEEPVAHNFNQPLYFSFPGTLLQGDGDYLDVLLYAYADHFGRLGPIWIGPPADLFSAYGRAYFQQITLAELGTALAVVTALFAGVIWIGSGFQSLYGFFVAATVAWAVNSLNYWVRDIPISHWAWDRLMNGALDQFAVFLAFFFHRVVEVDRPRVEKLLATFAIVAAAIAIGTPREHFAAATGATHAIITGIGAYVTMLAWTHRRSLSPVEARIYLGAWGLQLCFSANDLGIQFGLWRGLGYTLPYTVSFMMVAFGTNLALRFVRALREVRILNEELEERVRQREAALAEAFARQADLERGEILGRERQRLMREMHDGLGGQLVSSLAMVETGERSDPELVAALRESIEELRLVILSLDPGAAEVPALLAALRARLEPALDRRGIRFRWRVGEVPTPGRFGPEQLLSLLRVVQEAITNALRHAAPSTIEVTAEVEGDDLVISVRDDGQGFRGALRRGRGLTNMERRAEELGGTLAVRSDTGGTQVELRLPLSDGTPGASFSA
jgi:signal transduction histidine kinase